MFMSIREYFANIHVDITSQMYVHEQFTKYHELLVKVCELGGIFLQFTIRLSKIVHEVFTNIREHFANFHVHITSRTYVCS